MKINAVATLLFLSKEEIKIAVDQGIRHPDTDDLIKLEADIRGNNVNISDEQANAFIEKFDSGHQVRKYIKIGIRRDLFIESAYSCANCRQSNPLEIHHIIEWSKINHNDPSHLLVLCRNCHGLCTNGTISIPAQRKIKANLKTRALLLGDEFPAQLSWEMLREVIDIVHDVMGVNDEDDKSVESRTSFESIPLDEKNLINNMGEEYFHMMRERHLPHFHQIESFVRNPVNDNSTEKYYEIVDEINTRIAVDRDKFGRFEEIFLQILNKSKEAGFKYRHRALSIFLSFSYFQCDVGRRSV